MIPKLVVFDCDGVLVDSEGVTSDVLVENLNSHGLPITLRDVAELFTGGTMDGVFATAKARGADLPDRWVEDIYRVIYAKLAEGVPLIDGVVDLIDALEAAGVAVWVASNGTYRKMEITLTPSGLADRLAGRILSRQNFAPKPAPDMILHAMAQTGARAAETVMVDDSTAGCRAGVAAGVRTFGFATEGQDARLAAVGAEVVRSMAEIQRRLLG